MEFNIEKLFEKAFKDVVERKTNALKKKTMPTCNDSL